MTKISQEEYEILGGLYDMWKWIERNEKGELWAYKDKPTKEYKFRCEGILIGLKNGILQSIQWGDEEPYNIAELIEEYEIEQHIKESVELGEQAMRDHARKQLQDESEETEVKDIEWLKNEVLNQNLINKDGYIYAGNLTRLLNQLDEPEVLSPEWIDEKYFETENWDEDLFKSDGESIDHTPQIKVIAVQDLQKQLLPKQGLPVVPNYVAKWISEHHERFDLYLALRRLEEGCTRYYDAYKWYRANTLKFVVAYLTGVYEVEEEQKYVVKLPMSKNNDNQYAIVDYSGDIWNG